MLGFEWKRYSAVKRYNPYPEKAEYLGRIRRGIRVANEEIVGDEATRKFVTNDDKVGADWVKRLRHE